jgi:hypothetical protein
MVNQLPTKSAETSLLAAYYACQQDIIRNKNKPQLQ